MLLHKIVVLHQLLQHEVIHFCTSLVQCLPCWFVSHSWHGCVAFESFGCCTTHSRMRSSHPNFLQSKIWLFDWLRHSSFRSPLHIIPSNKVNDFSRIPLLRQIYDFSKHDHQVLLLFYIQLNLYFGLEMIYYHIPYIFLNKNIVNKSMALLFVKATMIGCKIGFLICTLNRSTPHPFSK